MPYGAPVLLLVYIQRKPYPLNRGPAWYTPPGSSSLLRLGGALVPPLTGGVFKRLASIFTEGDNTLPAGPATAPAAAAAATAAAAAATAATALAALPDLEPDPIYNISIPPPPLRVTEGNNNTLPAAGPAATKYTIRKKKKKYNTTSSLAAKEGICSIRKETAAAPATNPFFASPYAAATPSASLFFTRVTP
ncbi:hypothetical protein BT67DRAFT_433674 [Trichocladium antarcticum]|uniref:Uncharacterized protein n=1 Tax=Trichocladium antarcticum TaxID=1450529 RepID=A0AAN6ULA0_9PEZI|nr:hypothetical protein BT67DRAFT_433674 [Trichocladium antarcticum]